MLNNLFQRFGGGAGTVLNILNSHQYFLDRNTGLTNDARKEHYVFNPEYVLSNNRHFIAASQQEAQPNGDATTEGQSLQIIGYALAHIATGEKKWLDLAEKCFEAYMKYFYWEELNPMPNPPAKYICNWIVNGKEPVLANYPYNKEMPTHSGFKGTVFNFKNGLTKIPRDKPHFGQYLDKATFAFDGALAWDSIVGTVQAILPDGSTDWNKPGKQYDVEWIINWEGKKIDWDGNVESRDKWGDDPIIYPEADKGTVQLKDKTVQGDHKFNYTCRVPVADGGILIGRNAAQHNRPCHVPVPVDYMGNAADGEEWFADAAYILWKITGKERHYNAWQCAIETCKAYADIDSSDMFFRKSKVANTPYTEGIGYSYTYPSDLNVAFSRDADGYINAGVDESAQLTIEQQAIWFKVNSDSVLKVEYGGLDVAKESIAARAVLSLSTVKDDKAPVKRWLATLPRSTADAPKTYRIPLNNMTEETKDDGGAFIVADSRIMSDWGETKWTVEYENGVLSRNTNIIRATVPESSGLIVGFWLTDSKTAPIQSISYKSDKKAEVGFTDNAGWKWHYDLPNTANQWRTEQLNKPILNDYQPNHPDTDPRPTAPSNIVVTQVNIEPQEGAMNFSFYCFNEVPKLFSWSYAYTMKFGLTIQAESGFLGKIGDCTIEKYVDDNLFGTPGVIPFSNISMPGTEQFDGWRGLPYPGYQYPFIWCHTTKVGEPNKHLENMTEFLYQSQEWYKNKFGVTGPGASAYIWPRWDNLKYGKPDSWTMYHWGDGTAWSGYQPRAYAGAARAWYELVIQGKDVPPKLIEYVERWTDYVADFMRITQGHPPTDFPPDKPPVPWSPDSDEPFDDFTGHMSGLWLCGAAYAHLAGSTNPNNSYVMEGVVTELQDYLVVETPTEIMNGSWSPAIRSSSGEGAASNGMFFGFWSGEILRGLSLYLITKVIKPGEDMYKLTKE